MFRKFFLSLQILLALSKNLEALDIKNVTTDICNNTLAEESKELLATCRASVKVCIADCLGLKQSSDVSDQKDICWYNRWNGKIANLRKKKIKPFKPVNNSDFRIFCLYSTYTTGPNLTSLAATKLCTNIIVQGFIDASRKPNRDSYDFVFRKGEVDGVDNELKYIAANHKDVRLHLSFGDGGEESDRLFSEMVPNEERRKNFIDDMTTFLVLYNFTGLHLNWRFSICVMEWCNKETKSKKKNFSFLITELAKRFKPIAFMLSFELPREPDMIKEGFDVNVLADNVDFVIISTAFYRGMFDRTLEHQAVVNDFKTTLSIATETVNPINMKKFIVQMFVWWDVQIMASKAKTRTGSKSLGSAVRSKTFSMLCSEFNEQDWTVSKEATENLGFYAYKDDKWVAYDDVANIRFQAKFIREEKMLGVSFNNVNCDDYSGRCGCGKYPLLRAVSEELRGQRQELPDCT